MGVTPSSAVGVGCVCVGVMMSQGRLTAQSIERRGRARHGTAVHVLEGRHGIQDAPSALNAGSCFSASTRTRADARMAAACCFRTNGGGEVASVWGPSSSVGVMPRAAVRDYTCVCVCVGTREQAPVVWVGGWVFEAWLRQMCGRFESGRVGSGRVVWLALLRMHEATKHPLLLTSTIPQVMSVPTTSAIFR